MCNILHCFLLSATHPITIYRDLPSSLIPFHAVSLPALRSMLTLLDNSLLRRRRHSRSLNTNYRRKTSCSFRFRGKLWVRLLRSTSNGIVNGFILILLTRLNGWSAASPQNTHRNPFLILCLRMYKRKI